MGGERVDERLTNDVCLDEIPRLESGYRVFDAATLTILGDAPKVILVAPNSDHTRHGYIAKGPRREGPRECVTEYLISQIGHELPVLAAHGRVVRMPVRAGPVSGALDPDSRNFCPDDVRFLSRYFLRRDEQLVHGVELIAEIFGLPDTALQKEVAGREAERGFYTVGLIDDALGLVGRSKDVHSDLRKAFARMMAFDALIGANDRHPQNWGVITNALNAKAPPRFAPVFDSARGLLWNLTDTRLLEWDRSGERTAALARYAERSTPLIGVEGFKNPNHFDVIDYMVNHSGRGFGPAVRSVILSFSPRGCASLVHRAVGRFFSRRRLQCIVELLLLRHAKLVEICHGKAPGQDPWRNLPRVG